jgi:hypothetical protein
MKIFKDLSKSIMYLSVSAFIWILIVWGFLAYSGTVGNWHTPTAFWAVTFRDK